MANIETNACLGPIIKSVRVETGKKLRYWGVGVTTLSDEPPVDEEPSLAKKEEVNWCRIGLVRILYMSTHSRKGLLTCWIVIVAS